MQRRTKQENTLYELLNSFEGSGAPAGIAGYKVEDYIQIIRHYLDKRKLDKAERAVEDALQHFQYEAKLYALKAEILRKSGELDASLEMIEEAICISPLETQYTFDKALILSEMEEHDEAMRILSIIRPYLTGREMYLYHLCLSRVFESQNEYGQMFNSLEEALRFNPESEEALELMWSCVTMGRLHERSIRFHKKFLDKYPYSYLAWYNLGHAYSSLNMYELAIDTMEYSFLINEEFENGYMDCAEICQQVGMYQKAMEIYMEAYELFGPDAELNVLMAESLLKLGAYDKAKKYLLEAIYFDSYNDEAYYQLGLTYLAKRNWVAAEHAFDKAIGIEDQREEFYCGMAEAHMHQGRLDEAEENLQTAIELGPDNARFWLLMCQLRMNQGLYEEVLQTLEEAEENSESQEFDYYRAAALFHMQRKKEALVVLESALREGFAAHGKLFEISPALQNDSDVLSIIHYFEGEPSNAQY